MPNWLASMQQTYEYYEVDPGTWSDKKRLENIKSCSIVRDLDNDTLGSASIQTSEQLGEMYIRCYLVTTQRRIVERTPLGTHLYQTTSSGHDGKTSAIGLDGYSPLIELKESMPPIGYSLGGNTNILTMATTLVREHARAPVVAGKSDAVLKTPFVASTEDTWFTYVRDYIYAASYHFDLDDMGRILFAPDQDFNSLRPIWTYDDGNSSILYPDIDMDRDLYGVPNVMEVVYSRSNGVTLFSRVVNDDPNSPISTVNRGREVVSRINDPELTGEPTQYMLDQYARQALRNASTLEHTLKYSHGYCPVTIGNCVLLNYERAGLRNIKAKVTRQSIKCETGCKVEETAVYTTSLWG